MSKSGMKKSIKKYWLFLFLAFLVLAIHFLNISYHDFIHTLRSLQLWQILAVVLVFFLVSAANIMARKALISFMSATASFKNLTFIHFASMAAHYSTPAKIGFPLTIYFLNKTEKIPYGTGTAVVFLELFYSLLISGLIAFIGSFFFFQQKALLFLVALMAVGAIGIGFFLILVLAGRRQSSRIGRFFSELKNSLARLSLSQTLWYLLIRLGILVLSAINLILLSYFFSQQLAFAPALVASNSAFFLGAISMVPMGLGTREASMLFYLDFFGIHLDVAISIITIQRLISTGLTFVIGSILLSHFGMKYINQKKNNHSSKII